MYSLFKSYFLAPTLCAVLIIVSTSCAKHKNAVKSADSENEGDTRSASAVPGFGPSYPYIAGAKVVGDCVDFELFFGDRTGPVCFKGKRLPPPTHVNLFHAAALYCTGYASQCPTLNAVPVLIPGGGVGPGRRGGFCQCQEPPVSLADQVLKFYADVEQTEARRDPAHLKWALAFMSNGTSLATYKRAIVNELLFESSVRGIWASFPQTADPSPVGLEWVRSYIVGGKSLKDYRALLSVPLAALSFRADVNGDGLTDNIIFDRATAQWRVGLSGTAPTVVYAAWSRAVKWVNPLVADFNGDGKADVIAREGGTWWIGVSQGAAFKTNYAGAAGVWSLAVTWVDVEARDVTGDGRAEILGREMGSYRVWAGISSVTSDGSVLLTNKLVGNPPAISTIPNRPPTPGVSRSGETVGNCAFAFPFKQNDQLKWITPCDPGAAAIDAAPYCNRFSFQCESKIAVPSLVEEAPSIRFARCVCK